MIYVKTTFLTQRFTYTVLWTDESNVLRVTITFERAFQYKSLKFQNDDYSDSFGLF